MTLEEFQARVARYCQAYGVEPPTEGPPAYPAGQRETPQHREWLLLYKAHQRLAKAAGASVLRLADGRSRKV